MYLFRKDASSCRPKGSNLANIHSGAIRTEEILFNETIKEGEKNVEKYIYTLRAARFPNIVLTPNHHRPP